MSSPSKPSGSQRMAAVQTPVIPTIGALIKESPGTLSLAQGVVYFQPPQKAFEKIKGFDQNALNHRYAPVQGIPELIQLITHKLHRENGYTADLENRVIVTAGANMAFLNALFAITDPGDEIILPTPYYFNQEMAIRMVSCDPILVSTDENYQLNPEKLRKAITPKTRAIVTISPNNPTGVVTPPETLREINRICKVAGIYHICDEAYEYFLHGITTHYSPGSEAEAQDHTIGLYSLSKAYGFASWRIGYMVIPEQLFMNVLKAQDTNLICASLIAQHAAIGALETGRDYCLAQFDQIQQSREIFLKELESIRTFCTIPPSEGAFYLLLKIETSIDPMALVKKLIADYRVAVIPGDAFGIHKGCYLRVAYGALESDQAKEGIQRLVKGLRAIIEEADMASIN